MIEFSEWIKPGIVFRVKYRGWKKRYYYFKRTETSDCCSDLVCPFYRNCMKIKVGGGKLFSEMCNNLGHEEEIQKLLKDYDTSYRFFRPMTKEERDRI